MPAVTAGPPHSKAYIILPKRKVFRLDQFQVSPTLVFTIAFVVLAVGAIAFVLTNKKVQQHFVSFFPKKSGKKNSRLQQVLLSVLTFIVAVVVLYMVSHAR